MWLYRSRTIKWCTVLLLLVAVAPSIALGASLPQKVVPCGGVDCTVCDIAILAQNVLNTGIFIAVFLSAVLFAWAGGKMLMSSGSTEAVSEARKIFTNVAVGLVIILAGWLVVDTLMKTLTNAQFGPWNKICELLLQSTGLA